MKALKYYTKVEILDVIISMRKTAMLYKQKVVKSRVAAMKSWLQ